MQRWEYLMTGWHMGTFFIRVSPHQVRANVLTHLNTVEGVSIDQKVTSHGYFKVNPNRKENPCWQADLWNALGSEGWELSGTSATENATSCTFKRPLVRE